MIAVFLKSSLWQQIKGWNYCPVSLLSDVKSLKCKTFKSPWEMWSFFSDAQHGQNWLFKWLWFYWCKNKWKIIFQMILEIVLLSKFDLSSYIASNTWLCSMKFHWCEVMFAFRILLFGLAWNIFVIYELVLLIISLIC